MKRKSNLQSALLRARFMVTEDETTAATEWLKDRGYEPEDESLASFLLAGYLKFTCVRMSKLICDLTPATSTSTIADATDGARKD